MKITWQRILSGLMYGGGFYFLLEQHNFALAAGVLLIVGAVELRLTEKLPK